MYQKYHTEALVLGSREQGEADKVFALYTKDFGLVRARASAVRREHSRMRYALQNYSHTHVALVRGKHLWRIGGVSVIHSSGGMNESVATFARIARLVLRLVAGEGENDYVFAALSGAHHALMRDDHETRATIELMCVARILYGLGYISSEALDTALFTHAAYTPEHVQEAEVFKGALLSSINRAINETHL